MNKVINEFLKFLPDSLYIKLKYNRKYGNFPRIKDPETFTDKINWLKINERKPIQTLCSDKFLVRDFIKSSFGEKYLIPLLYQTYDIDSLIPENLPDIPFIIKTNHDSQKPIIVYDKDQHNWDKIRSFLSEKMKKNYFFEDREWQYKDIRPCIIVEKLLLDSKGRIPNDLKVFRINGKSEFIMVDKNRHKSNQSRYFFDTEWKLTDYRYGDYGIDTEEKVNKPKNLDKMLFMSESILKEFQFLRFDWYECDDKLYFGEITFHPGGGFEKFRPDSLNKKIGQMINLKT